ncbi:hypothetical protein EDD85DRAFT_952333 [Armillaria nabsnona]|nr:hypothetical protein EDD85DRAFT_952333 [Armillaria nabsnona]
MFTSRCFCFGPVSDGNLSGAPQKIRASFTIFIQGVAPHTLPLRVDGSLTVHDVQNIIEKHVAQAGCILAALFNCYLVGRWRPLLAEETLDSLNVRDLSHFYIRYVLPGGTGMLYSNIGQSQILEASTDAFDVTLSPDLSPDHCQYICCTNHSATREPYKFKPNEEKFHIQACLAAAGPATLHRLQMQTLTLTTCGTCAALAAQKNATFQHRELSKSVDQWALSLTANSLPTVASVSQAELQKQNLTSSGNVFTVPDIATIDRSIKNAKAKGAHPEARLPVAISSRLKKDSLKTGYSIAHIRHESETQKYRRLALEGQSGESARVFVQVKRENGTKKGLSFWNIQQDVKFPAATSQSDVANLIIKSLLVVIHGHPNVQGFSFVAGDFFLVDSGWSPILDGDPDELTELFYKGLATSSKKKGIAGVKFVQPAQENWFMVIKPAIANKHDIWAAGGEITPMSMPVKRAIRKKKGCPIPMQSIGASEVSEQDVCYNSDTILGDNSLFFDSNVSMVSGPPSSISSGYSQSSSKSKLSSKRSVSLS